MGALTNRGVACGRGWLAATLTLLAALLPGSAAGQPAATASPDTQAIMEKAVHYLEEQGSSDSRPGALALAGMAIYKHRGDANQPAVLRQVEGVRQALQQGLPQWGTNWVYSGGICTMFLCELDSRRYRAEIEQLIGGLVAGQKPHGGWGYADRPTGDTSMTQYAVQSLWIAAQAGFHVPQATIERSANWLMLTQDPEGGYGYQGKVAPSHSSLIQQADVWLTMTAGGMGSIYANADLLGFTSSLQQAAELPPALRQIKTAPTRVRRQTSTQIDPALFTATFARGNQWFKSHYQIELPTGRGNYQYYYLYAVERYQSFRELVDGRTTDLPPWYPQGVEYLATHQSDDGSWEDQCGRVPATAFGTLFLMRAMQKTIEKVKSFGDGMMVGGRGLPKNTALLEVREGQIVAKPLLGPAEQLLAVLKDPKQADYGEAIEALSRAPAADIRDVVSRNAEKLRQLAADDSPAARLAAVQALARSRDMEHVPTLIYALSDPEPEVVLAAHEGLKRISRKLDGFGLSESPSENEIRQVIEKWKAWYLSVRPDAEFETPH